MGRSYDRCAVFAGVAFLGIAALSLIWTPFLDDGILEIAYFSVFAGAIILGATLENLRCVFLAAAFGIGLNSLIAISQWMGYQPVTSLTPHPSGLFLNANILAETSSLVMTALVVAAAGMTWVPTFVFASLCLPSLLLPLHRGSLAALAVAIFLGCRSYWLKGLSLVALLAVPLLKWESATLAERITIWHAAIDGLTWFGHGAGSFRGLFALYAAPYADTLNLSALHAHNDILELAFNYGIFAALPLCGVAYVLLKSPSPLRLVVVVFVVEGLFEFPLFMPASSFLAALALGACARDLVKLRNAEPRRRVVPFTGYDHPQSGRS